VRQLVTIFLTAAAPTFALAQTAGTTFPPPTPPSVDKTNADTMRNVGNLLGRAQKVTVDLKVWSDIEARVKITLREAGLTPESGKTQLFQVRLFGDDTTGQRDIHSIERLSQGDNFEQALIESFAAPNGVGSSDRLQSSPPAGKKEYSTYLTAQPSGGNYDVRLQSMTQEYYDQAREKGIGLREARRIQALRDEAVRDFAAKDPQAQAEWKRLHDARVERARRSSERPPMIVISPPGGTDWRGSVTPLR
jgi:hypothetical protein